MRVLCLGLFMAISLSNTFPVRALQKQSPTQRIVLEGALDSLGDIGISEEELEESSGNSELDRKIIFTHRTLTALFRLKTNVLFFDELGGPSAFAVKTLDQKNFHGGTVLLGKKLLVEIAKLSDKDDIVLTSIIAHEMGHLFQFGNHSQLKGKSLELHADYIAGWALRNYLTNSKQDNKSFQDATKKVLEDFYARGDFLDYANSKHHGTPLERMGAMLAGVLLREENPETAYAKGTGYVAALAKESTKGSAAELIETIDYLKKRFAESTPFYSVLLKSAELLKTWHSYPSGFLDQDSKNCTVWIKYERRERFTEDVGVVYFRIYRIPLSEIDTVAYPEKGQNFDVTVKTLSNIFSIQEVDLVQKTMKKSSQLNLPYINREIAPSIGRALTKAVALCKETKEEDPFSRP